MKSVYQFKINFLNSKNKGLSYRLLIPESYTLLKLHLAIQDVFGFHNQDIFFFIIENDVFDCRSMKNAQLMIAQLQLDSDMTIIYNYGLDVYSSREIILEKILTCNEKSYLPHCSVGDSKDFLEIFSEVNIHDKKQECHFDASVDQGVDVSAANECMS